MLDYYESKNEDPKYSGLCESKFCNEFSKFMGGGYTDAVATGTGAILYCNESFRSSKKSEVIICPVTCSGNLS